MKRAELNILPGTAQLLVEGGDKRIQLDPLLGVNRYGCGAIPDPGLLDFSSATASVISVGAFDSAGRLRERLDREIVYLSPAAIYAREIARMRMDLLDLCELGNIPEPDIVFAASGTDLHRIAAQLTQAAAGLPALVLMVDETETGSGIRAAIKGSGHSIEIAAVPLRRADGLPRRAAEIDADFCGLARQAHAAGRQVLLIQADVSKTGMIAPSYACTAALQQALGNRLDVLIDACQFRIAPATLRACLDRGYSVALTGSKFVGGPSFSGALLIPANTVDRFRNRPLPRIPANYPAAADWPDGWPAPGVLAPSWNFGLLLRWDAALYELRAFRALHEADVTRFLQTFAQAIHARFSGNPAFSPVDVPVLDRGALLENSCWDQVQTIFPFQLYQFSASDRRPLDSEQTQKVFRRLPSAPARCQIGQPVNYSAQHNALRLCLSARQIVQGVVSEGGDAGPVIAQASTVLEQAARLANLV
ncbi:MAG: hypothetical protein WCA64_04870 [Gallionella sp.]